jgi:hypothetical protein
LIGDSHTILRRFGSASPAKETQAAVGHKEKTNKQVLNLLIHLSYLGPKQPSGRTEIMIDPKFLFKPATDLLCSCYNGKSTR